MNGFADLEAVERDAKRTWANDPATRAEFADSESTYLAYRRAEAQGRVRTLGARPAGAAAVVSNATPKAEAESIWANDASIRAAFLSKEDFLAYHRAAAAGRVRVAGGNSATSAPAVAAARSAPPDASSLAARQAEVRRENVGRIFAGLPPLDIPQT